LRNFVLNFTCNYDLKLRTSSLPHVHDTLRNRQSVEADVGVGDMVAVSQAIR